MEPEKKRSNNMGMGMENWKGRVASGGEEEGQASDGHRWPFTREPANESIGKFRIVPALTTGVSFVMKTLGTPSDIYSDWHCFNSGHHPLAGTNIEL